MSLQPADRRDFHPTRWSLILQVQEGGADASQALEELCRAYWFPLYGWARRSGASPSDAEDLVQGFFADVISGGLFARADARKGRLRTLLLTAFRRYGRDAAVRAGAEKRGGGRVVSFDAVSGEEWYLADAAVEAAPDAFFDRQWALAVLEQAVARTREEYASRGKGEQFDLLRPYLTEASKDGYLAEAAALGITPGAAKVAVHRLRERFRVILREQVAQLQAEEENVEEELAYLLRALEA